MLHLLDKTMQYYNNANVLCDKSIPGSVSIILNLMFFYLFISSLALLVVYSVAKIFSDKLDAEKEYYAVRLLHDVKPQQ